MILLLLGTIFWYKYVWISHFLIFVCLLRTFMGFVDLDEKRNTVSKEENSIYVLLTALAVFQYVLYHNLISKSYWLM